MTDNRLSKDSDQRQPRRSAERGVVRGHVVVAVEVLRKRIAEPWTLDALTEEVHLSRSQLVRSFDATVRTSPMAYLRQMRVERMAQLLLGTDLSVAEVAGAVGWTDPSYAIRCFHIAYGVSPTAYRHQHAPAPGTSAGTVSPSPDT
jgi:transcriptional regulator GlxA family with amidase domain